MVEKEGKKQLQGTSLKKEVSWRKGVKWFMGSCESLMDTEGKRGDPPALMGDAGMYIEKIGDKYLLN